MLAGSVFIQTANMHLLYDRLCGYHRAAHTSTYDAHIVLFPDIHRVNVPWGVCCAPLELCCLEVTSIPRGPIFPSDSRGHILRHVSFKTYFPFSRWGNFPWPNLALRKTISKVIFHWAGRTVAAKPDHRVNMQETEAWKQTNCVI